ncbi:hypothetical protein G7Y89_g5730 [Cudoniella acicularis]|uniref:Uncharacterized protein n=1 Tax=Cudoniella acicularis TaxID=354080 RepID=A0A8H4RNI5_9HELO|nr:hypothetical protein G7Y89_g5730 [Cudoniella acicularis]
MSRTQISILNSRLPTRPRPQPSPPRRDGDGDGDALPSCASKDGSVGNPSRLARPPANLARRPSLRCRRRHFRADRRRGRDEMDLGAEVRLVSERTGSDDTVDTNNACKSVEEPGVLVSRPDCVASLAHSSLLGHDRDPHEPAGSDLKPLRPPSTHADVSAQSNERLLTAGSAKNPAWRLLELANPPRYRASTRHPSCLLLPVYVPASFYPPVFIVNVGFGAPYPVMPTQSILLGALGHSGIAGFESGQ